MAKVKLTSLKCIKHSSGAGDDDVYMNVMVDNGHWQKKVWGGDDGTCIDEGTSKTFDLEYDISSNIQVEIWDYDSGSSDDHLGTTTISTTDKSGYKILSDSDEEDEYWLYYQIS